VLINRKTGLWRDLETDNRGGWLTKRSARRSKSFNRPVKASRWSQLSCEGGKTGMENVEISMSIVPQAF
jgi:hypothetical protein